MMTSPSDNTADATHAPIVEPRAPPLADVAMKSVTPADGAAWLAWRRAGIGGSDVAKLAEGKRWAVWLDKVHNIRTDEDDNEDGKSWGQAMEPVIAAWVAQREGWTITPGGYFEDDWRRASVDYLIESPFGGIAECKCRQWTGLETWGGKGDAADDGTAPITVRAQVTWYGIVLPERRHDLYVLPHISGRAPFAMHCPWDENFAGLLLETAERFWRDHVLTAKEPPPDATEECGAGLTALHKGEEGRKIELDPAAFGPLCAQWQENKIALEAATERKALLAHTFQQHMGEAVKATCEYEGRNYSIPWSKIDGGIVFDEARFAAEQPETYERYCRVGKGHRRFAGVNVLKTKKGK